MVKNFPYKNRAQAHSQNITIDQPFGGMKYVDTPLEDGHCALLQNVDITSSNTLRVRKGYKSSDVIKAFVSTNPVVNHSGVMYVKYLNEDDAELLHYALVGNTWDKPVEAQGTNIPDTMMEFNQDTCIIFEHGEDNTRPYDDYILATYDNTLEDAVQIGGDYKVCSTLIPAPKELHNIPKCNVKPSDGAHASFNNNTYVCVWELKHNQTTWDIRTSICMIYAEYNALRTQVKWCLKKLVPNNITAVKAVNYGYNMLLSDPYHFTNQAVSTTALLLDGIIPYDSSGRVITSCRPGEEVTFKVAYRYPQSWVDQNVTLCVRWTITNNDAEQGSSDTLVQIRTSKTTINNPIVLGDDIAITTCQTSYNNFTLTCNVYRCDKVMQVEYESDIIDAVTLTPENTMSVAFSYLTADKPASTINLAEAKYELTTAKGMTTWMQRMVIWGVRNAETTLFVSEINDPSYFPYPNNVEIFDSPIVTAVPFKTALIVFTKTTIYQLEFAQDGITYTTKVIQQNINMEYGDAKSVLAIQNMLFFKNGNYYYMLVPGKYLTNNYGELMLAPISSDIEGYLDNHVFADQVDDWWCFTEHNFFCVGFVDESSTTTTIVKYNVKTRAWTTEMISASARLHQWVPAVTIDSSYICVDTHLGVANMHLIERCEEPQDDLPFINDNGVEVIIDTGARTFEIPYTKKWRALKLDITTNEDVVIPIFCTAIADNNAVLVNDYSDVDEDTHTVTIGLGQVVREDTRLYNAKLDSDYPAKIPQGCTAHIQFGCSAKQLRTRLNITSYDATFRYEIRNVQWVYRMKASTKQFREE